MLTIQKIPEKWKKEKVKKKPVKKALRQVGRPRTFYTKPFPPIPTLIPLISKFPMLIIPLIHSHTHSLIATLLTHSSCVNLKPILLHNTKIPTNSSSSTQPHKHTTRTTRTTHLTLIQLAKHTVSSELHKWYKHTFCNVWRRVKHRIRSNEHPDVIISFLGWLLFLNGAQSVTWCAEWEFSFHVFSLSLIFTFFVWYSSPYPATFCHSPLFTQPTIQSGLSSFLERKDHIYIYIFGKSYRLRS